MNIQSESNAREYQLIDWSKPANPYQPNNIVKLTSHEAGVLNRGFAFNRLTLRYIKCTTTE